MLLFNLRIKCTVLTSGPKSERSRRVPDEARLEVTKRVQQAKKRAREEETCISTPCNDAMCDLYDTLLLLRRD